MKYDKRFQTIAFLTLACFIWCMPSFAAHDGDKIERVLQKTLEDSGHTVTFMRSGKPTDEFFTIKAYDPNVDGLQLQATGYASKKVKDALEQIGQAFGEMAKAQYGGATPSVSTSTVVFDGVSVKRAVSAAQDYEGQIMKVSMPKMTTLYFHANPLLAFGVTVQGDRNPDPYMKALIKNMKEAGMLGPVEEGVEFTIQVRKDGWIPLNRPVATGPMSPSSITVTGTVVDLNGDPVSGAKLHVPSLNISYETGMDGKYRLHAATKGKDPFSIDLTLHLQQPTSGTTVKITGPSEPVLRVPGTPKLKITGTDKDGKPLKNARVELKWTVPKFVKTTMTTDTLNDKGELEVPLNIEKPEGLAGLAADASALNVKLEAIVKPRDGGESGKAVFTAPLNLALVIGQTTGPDMKPRVEKEAPWAVLGDYRNQCLDSQKDDTGRFQVLVQPLHPLKMSPFDGWALRWSDQNRIPMNCLIKPAPGPGKVVDVGLIDVLTVDEHVERIRSVLKEFCDAMPLTPTEKSTAQAAISRLAFNDGYARTAPLYMDNYTDNSGQVGIPGKAEHYWGTNLMENNDAAYQIIPHEFGHFMHHHIIEKYAFRHVFYNSLSTGDHNTWAAPPGSDLKKKYLSFSENTADFFAMLFRNFWTDRHPEIEDSPYFKLTGYLHEFEDDKQAMAVIGAGSPGYQVEGVQSRFLTVFYGNAVNTRPAQVFTDYLNTMLLHVDRKTGWVETLVNRPARTMPEWIRTKHRVPSGLGSTNLMSLANRYRMIPGVAPTPTISPAFRDKDVKIQVDSKTEDFKSFPVIPAPLNKMIHVYDGMISIDVSTATEIRTLTVRARARFKLLSPTKVEVRKGLIGADFPVELVTPGGTVKPTGTVVQVDVDDAGKARIDTLDGTVQVTSNDGTIRTLNVGESIEMAADGTLSAISTCDPAALVADLLPNVELPPIPEKRTGISMDWTGLKDRIKGLPWWAILLAGILVFVLFGTLLFLFRRLLAALIAGPLMAIALVAVGRLLLTNPAVEHMAFSELLMSPWTAWQTGNEWLPGAAWMIGGLVAGMIVGGAIRSLFTGLLVPLVPWAIYHHELTTPVSWNLDGILDSLLRLATASPENLLALAGATTLTAMLGGLLLPRTKSTPIPAGNARQPKRRMINRDNDGDWYDYPDDDGGFDGGDGDD